MLKNSYAGLFISLLVLIFFIETAQAKEIHPMPYLYLSEVASWILNDEFVICDDCFDETFEQDEFDVSDSLFVIDDEAAIDETLLFHEKKCFIEDDGSD